VLCTTAADLAIHPIHVLGEPISCDEAHAFPQLPQHVIELGIAWTHGHNELAAFLADDCGEGEVVARNIEPL